MNFVAPLNKCYTYGNDAFYAWAYGPATNMTWAGRTAAGVDTWVMASGSPQEYSWLTQDVGGGLCQPLAWYRGQAKAVLTGFLAGPVDPSVFVPAPGCTTNPVFAGCRAHAAKALWEAGAF